MRGRLQAERGKLEDKNNQLKEADIEAVLTFSINLEKTTIAYRKIRRF